MSPWTSETSKPRGSVGFGRGFGRGPGGPAEVAAGLVDEAGHEVVGDVDGVAEAVVAGAGHGRVAAVLLPAADLAGEVAVGAERPLGIDVSAGPVALEQEQPHGVPRGGRV